jgi:hypothetical protein
LGGVLFVHSYRRQIGESLIGWGARLAAKPQVAAQPESPAPQAALPKHRSIPRPPQVASPVRSSAPRAPVPIPVSQSKKPQPQPSTVNPAKPEQRKLAPDRQVVVASGVAARPVLKAESSPGTIGVSSTRPTISLPNTAVAPAANVAPGRSRSTPKLEQESHPGGHAVSGVYLEVGKFKDALEADQARKKLTQLGFYASVAPRNRLWMLSYYLLVGPYADDRAEPARKSLEAHGFKTQAFERGSRSFTVYGGCDTMTRLLRTGLTPNRPGMPVEECLISWESYSNRAIVKFVQDSSVVATADGRWVSRGLRFVQDAFVYRENDDGTRTLLEIQFAGMSQALVFDKSS